MIFKYGCEYREIAREPFCWGPWACCHISCHSSPLFLKNGRSAESLLHCPAPHADSIDFPSILDFWINLLSFNSIATSCGWEWGEGPSLGLGDWFCYIWVAVAPFLFCSSPAPALAQGMLRKGCSQLMQKGCMGSSVFRISTCIFTFLVPILYALAPWTCLTRCVCTSKFSLNYLSPYSILSIIQIAIDNSSGAFKKMKKTKFSVWNQLLVICLPHQEMSVFRFEIQILT